jgi:hypothetical protein
MLVCGLVERLRVPPPKSANRRGAEKKRASAKRKGRTKQASKSKKCVS